MSMSTQLSCRLTSAASSRPLHSPSRLYVARSSSAATTSTRCAEIDSKIAWISTGTLTSWLLSSGQAVAVDREYGILEGTIVSMIHPLVMISFFGATCYAGWLGWQWRRLREIGNEIRELKKQLPKADTEGNIPPSPISDQIALLETTRKELAAGGYRDRHHNMGSILLGGGTFIALFGCMNTYLRTNKLFPGPHLFAGATIIALWASAASLVPQMQKGNDTARSVHIALNFINVCLFVWQIPTGFEIIGKVLEFTVFP